MSSLPLASRATILLLTEQASGSSLPFFPQHAPSLLRTPLASQPSASIHTTGLSRLCLTFTTLSVSLCKAQATVMERVGGHTVDPPGRTTDYMSISQEVYLQSGDKTPFFHPSGSKNEMLASIKKSLAS